MYTIILQMPAGGTSAGSKFTRAWDSTVGVGASFYWLAAAFLLVIAFGAVKAYRDDKKWEGKKMDIIQSGAKVGQGRGIGCQIREKEETVSAIVDRPQRETVRSLLTSL
jgi:hypothetical protein